MISVEKGWVETLLNQNLPKQSLLSQQYGASTCAHKNEDSEELDSSNNHEQNLSSTTLWNNEELQDSITVCRPVQSLPIGARHTTPSQNPPAAPNITFFSTSEFMVAEGEQGLSQRPQRLRKQSEHFQPAAWRAMMPRLNDKPQTLGDVLAFVAST